MIAASQVADRKDYLAVTKAIPAYSRLFKHFRPPPGALAGGTAIPTSVLSTRTAYSARIFHSKYFKAVQLTSKAFE